MKEILSEEMLYLFTGIEEGWIKPSNKDLELYYAYRNWIKVK